MICGRLKNNFSWSHNRIDIKPGGTFLAPNPVRDGNVTVQFVNQPEGLYAIRLISGLGQVVYNQSVNHAGGNTSNRIKLSSSIAGGMYKLDIIQPDKTHHVQNLVVSNGN